uniref:Uncharacterized protein n=1 Tax=Chromera velia CCMP2878 TaxID=1169474 RepID=A0A0K6S770_9ALVE|eukprot:Cvel_19997.t2-p1 / transcript=Cvel_19997.t2 / gene=Cvel_19997 / organism=Chromera_velia_CCMP2878 / gene_product=hypothetical protein / transcript_product=hypothetical protein / location=Cvel_scaffold1762:20930-21523(+) / protein_length=198 / sequence_SO=supercontig / SO=protein_coding / is_pseudo=false
MEAGGGLAETLAATRVGIEVVLAQSLKEADAEGESAEEMEEKVNKLRKGAKGVQVSLWATVAPPTVLKGRLARLRGRAVVLYSKKSLRRQLNASATLHASWRSCIEEDTFQQHRIFLVRVIFAELPFGFSPGNFHHPRGSFDALYSFLEEKLLCVSPVSAEDLWKIINGTGQSPVGRGGREGRMLVMTGTSRFFCSST